MTGRSLTHWSLAWGLQWSLTGRSLASDLQWSLTGRSLAWGLLWSQSDQRVMKSRVNTLESKPGENLETGKPGENMENLELFEGVQVGLESR